MEEYKIASSVNVGETMAPALQHREVKLTMTQLGNILHYNQSTISRFANGKQNVPYEALQQLLETVPDPFLAMDISNKLIGVTVPVINGSHVIKEPLAMAIKAVKEAKEAVEAIIESEDEYTTPSDYWTREQHADPEQSINESLDAILFLQNYVAFACRETGLNFQEILTKRTQKWRREGITN